MTRTDIRRLNVTVLRAARHEALYVRLAALLQQADGIARRRPDLAVPADTRATAETLLFEAEALLAPRRARHLPPAAEGFAGLALQLGQALARLDAFELAHTAWNADLKCFVWRVERDAPLPVQRLRPETTAVLKTVDEEKRMAGFRKKVLDRLNERAIEGYEQGYADAKAGRPAASEDTLVRR